MSKITLQDLDSIQNDPTAVDTINDNSDVIVSAFDNTLSRDGTSPNQMNADLDMNSHKILNLPAPRSPLEPARLKDIGDAPSYAEEAKEWAEAAHADRLLADADVVLTHADVALTHADVVLTHADVVTTHADVVTTHADVVLANAAKDAAEGFASDASDDAAAAHADRLLADADVPLTHADVVSTHSDVVLTHADVITTGNDVTSAATSASNAHISEINAAQSLSDFKSEYLGPLASNPVGSYSEGTLYWNTTTDSLMVFDGSNWVSYNPSVSGGVQTIVAGTNITVDDTDPANPIVSSTGSVISVNSGVDITVDNTDPANPVVNYTGTGGVSSVVAGDHITVDNSTPSAPIVSAIGDGASFVNRVINPSGQIWQRANTGAAAITDVTYCFDQWYGLTQSAGITASQVTNAENGTPYMMRLSQANATAQRFGIAQPLESLNVIDLRGQDITLSARVRMSASTTLRYALIEFTGTADTLTKDVVNNWTSTNYTPGNFFISTNTTIVATGSTSLIASTLTSINLTGTVSSSMNNLIVFFWTDSTQAQNVTLDIGKVQLEKGSSVTPLALRSITNELMLCYRYYEYGENNAWNANVYLTFTFKSNKRTTPSMSFNIPPSIGVTVNSRNFYSLRTVTSDFYYIADASL